MSTALSLSAVTAVLQYLFNQIYNASDLGTVSITAVAPDVAQANLGADSSTQLQVNLFLHQVTLNPALRNIGLPVLAADGSTQLTNPPVALDLHYLLTAYASYNTGAEALLGYGVQFLVQNPVLTRAQINAAFLHKNLPSSSKNPLASSLGLAGLYEQIEMIKIIPATLGREEIAWLWTALKADYRPTFPFQASVVLIQSQNPVKSALPVLKRSVSAQANTLSPFGALTAVNSPGNQPAASLGDTVTVKGANLSNAINVVLINSRLGVQRTIPASSARDPGHPSNSPCLILLRRRHRQLPLTCRQACTSSQQKWKMGSISFPPTACPSRSLQRLLHLHPRRSHETQRGMPRLASPVPPSYVPARRFR